MDAETALRKGSSAGTADGENMPQLKSIERGLGL